jgi:hypothetical protein
MNHGFSSSANCDISARAWIVPFQEKRKNEHDGAERAQDPKDIHIGQGPALLMYQLVEPRDRLVPWPAGVKSDCP